MTDTRTETRSVIVEREVRHPPEKIWRALTQPHLIEAWLMKNNFQPVVGQGFRLDAEWGGVDCKVLELEPPRMLAYTWEAQGLESVVTWTLTPIDAGTHLRMEQTGFTRDHKMAYGGALAGWPRFFDSLEKVVAGLKDGDAQ